MNFAVRRRLVVGTAPLVVSCVAIAAVCVCAASRATLWLWLSLPVPLSILATGLVVVYASQQQRLAWNPTDGRLYVHSRRAWGDAEDRQAWPTAVTYVTVRPATVAHQPVIEVDARVLPLLFRRWTLRTADEAQAAAWAARLTTAVRLPHPGHTVPSWARRMTKAAGESVASAGLLFLLHRSGFPSIGTVLVGVSGLSILLLSALGSVRAVLEPGKGLSETMMLCGREAFTIRSLARLPRISALQRERGVVFQLACTGVLARSTIGEFESATEALSAAHGDRSAKPA